MADRKIQIKNAGGDNLFPKTKRELIDDFNHTHTFTGTSGSVSVTGTYSKATGISINSITPSGSVTQPSFSGTVNLGSNTTSTNGTKYLEDISVTGGGATGSTSYMHWSAGTLPGRSTISVVTAVSGGGGSRTLSYLHQATISVTKGNYTPAGTVTISRSANVALATTTGVKASTSSTTGDHVTLTLSNITVATGTVNTQPNFSASFAGTTTNALVTAVGGGTITANATASGGIQFVREATFTNASGTTTTIGQITSTGTLPSLTFNGTSTGGTAYVYQVNGTAAGVTKTTKYLHPTVSGTVTKPTFTGNAVTPTGTLTLTSTSITCTGTFTSTGSVGNVQ